MGILMVCPIHLYALSYSVRKLIGENLNEPHNRKKFRWIVILRV